MAQVSITKLTEEEIASRGIIDWPIWTKEASTFDWEYSDREQCLILEGQVVVSTPEGDYSFGSGDFVTFEKGLKCVWKVTSPVRKHYQAVEKRKVFQQQALKLHKRPCYSAPDGSVEKA